MVMSSIRIETGVRKPTVSGPENGHSLTQPLLVLQNENSRSRGCILGWPLCSLSLVFPQGMFSRTLRRSLAPFASLLLRPNTFQQLHTTKEHRRGRLPLFHDYDFCNSSFFGLTSF